MDYSLIYAYLYVNFKGLVLFVEVENFRGFQVFDFGPYIEIENLGKLGNFLKTCKFQRTFIFEKLVNFRGFQVFDFGPYTEIEISEILCYKNLLYLSMEL